MQVKHRSLVLHKLLSLQYINARMYYCRNRIDLSRGPFLQIGINLSLAEKCHFTVSDNTQ